MSLSNHIEELKLMRVPILKLLRVKLQHYLLLQQRLEQLFPMWNVKKLMHLQTLGMHWV